MDPATTAAGRPVPVPVTVHRYRCLYCRHLRVKRATAVAHLTRCWHNPANRTCLTCDHYAPPLEGDRTSPPEPATCHAANGPRDLPTGQRFPMTHCPLWQGSHIG
jgi:hypothetical protein